MQPTQVLSRASSSIRRLRLTTKQAANKGGYYKGTGSGPMGRHTKHGGYVIEWRKVRTYTVPSELENCNLSPFVTNKITPKDLKEQNREYKSGRMKGSDYLKLWKTENGTD